MLTLSVGVVLENKNYSFITSLQISPRLAKDVSFNSYFFSISVPLLCFEKSNVRVGTFNTDDPVQQTSRFNRRIGLETLSLRFSIGLCER